MNTTLWFFIVYIQIVLHICYTSVRQFQNSAVTIGDSKNVINVCATTNTNDSAQQQVI